MACIYRWPKNEENAKTDALKDWTQALPKREKAKTSVRTRSHLGTRENKDLGHCAQNLSLSPRTGQEPSSRMDQVYTGDELWKHFRPQNLLQAWHFIGRVVEIKLEKRITYEGSAANSREPCTTYSCKRRGLGIRTHAFQFWVWTGWWWWWQIR